MKRLFTFILLFIFISNSNAQNENPNYDAKLAEELGADDYGMKQYVFVVLKTGTNTTTDKTFTSDCFKSHMENINKLVTEKKLIVAGPMSKNENNFRGIFILDVKTFEEANELLENDKAIKEKILAVELYKWYGSAALSQYLEASNKIWKINP
ncbi:YciI family protein [Flavobacterium sp. HNIBRBA15423]|uniref:YciI family protein n=1 Tax=Flavobacterium sp. HNIBRBA15423 TaxID=3458683 RepID=UPI0040441139